MSLTELPVSDIVAKDRLRPVSTAGVEAVMASITELGFMKDPIHVRKMRKSGEFRLLAGGHRLEAARRLGWETIPVTAWDCNDDFARLMEIDDNLAGAELTALDSAVFLAARKRVYEKMFPQAAAATGADLVAKRWNTADIMSVVSFASTTAEKFGLTERHVRRLVSAGGNLGPDEVAKLRAAPRSVTLKDLMVIGKIGNPVERYHVVEALADGSERSAAAALKAYHSVGERPADSDPVEQSYRKLVILYDRAPAAAKRLFEDFLRERAAEADNG
ncbi:ParB/RepB/Spo0J family partition protein [Litorisediminicola beolgyonensis]|uniref:ParB/RepB/Spo0J family partition protein n=2 Tax=Litorisediminicola beolgyonensis TaxID=1173614 RepID=A0ABW3ZIN6_9RHOB